MAGTRRALLLFALAGLLGSLAVAALLSPRTHGQSPACPFGGGPSFDIHTYAAARDRQVYLLTQRLSAADQLFPGLPTFALPQILTGQAGNRTPLQNGTIPAEILHAIGWIESNMIQAARHVPFESIGEALISPDCGYGIMQVTSYFNHDGGVPSRDEGLVGAHYANNIAVGAQILVEKWNSDFFPVVGQGNPNVIESWYYALWGYNGWSFRNHPVGAEVDPFRALPFSCDGPRNGYAYQELVLGCMQNPPDVDDLRLWNARPVQLPNLAALAVPGGPLDPDVYFAGWDTVFSAPFTGADASTPFRAMAMPLPPGATPVPPNSMSNPSAATVREQVLGAPVLALETREVRIRVTDDRIELRAITISNSGQGLLVYRVVADVPWIEVDIVVGVAAGTDVPFRDGLRRSATITVRPDAQGLVAGIHHGTISIEALMPDGGIRIETVSVELDKEGVPSYEAGTPIS